MREPTAVHTFLLTLALSFCHSHPPGGIGIAAALSVLEELPVSPGDPPAAAAGDAPAVTNLRHPPVLLIWAARHPAELLVLGPRVAAAAAAKGVTLTAHIYYTGACVGLCGVYLAAAAQFTFVCAALQSQRVLVSVSSVSAAL